MHDDIDWRLLDRTLAGEASPEEIARVEAWFDAKPERRAVFKYLKQNAAATSVDVESAWQRVAARTVAVGAGEDARRGAHHRTPEIAVRPSRMSQRWRVAAAVLLVAASAASWRAFARPRVAPDHTLTWREMTVPRGSRASIDLADGSRVVLNAGSRLRYSANMGTGARDVYLDGEGYFVVHHDAARPFRVHAGSAIATDVGTRFAVRAYAGTAGGDGGCGGGRRFVAHRELGDNGQRVLDCGNAWARRPRRIIVTPARRCCALHRMDGGPPRAR